MPRLRVTRRVRAARMAQRTRFAPATVHGTLQRFGLHRPCAHPSWV